MIENKFCFRVERRTVIPGIPIETGVIVNGFQKIDFSTDGYIIIPHYSEQIMGRGGMEYRYTSDLPKSDYFSHEADADEIAYRLHLRRCPNPSVCGWRVLDELTSFTLEESDK